MSITTRGGSHRVKINHKGKLLVSRSFTALAEARAFEKVEYAKLQLGIFPGDEVVPHPSGAGTTLHGFTKPRLASKSEAEAYPKLIDSRWLVSSPSTPLPAISATSHNPARTARRKSARRARRARRSAISSNGLRPK